jgi:chlorophyll(ide) b reductase
MECMYVCMHLLRGVIGGWSCAGGESHQEGVLWFSWLAGVVVGSMIGAGQVLESHARSGHRNVVITGR